MTDRFVRFAAIDWSGAKGRRHKGIAVAVCDAGDAAPRLIAPPDRYWSRTAILDWVLEQADTPTLIGFDLSPGFPFIDREAFFPGWEGAPTDARQLWAVIDALCGDEIDLGANRFVDHIEARRHFRHQTFCGDQFAPGRGRLRRCESDQNAMQLSPSSCFNLVGASQVGKSSLTGMRLLHRLGGRIPVWPFDDIAASGSVVVEIYTSLAARAAKLPAGRSKIRDGIALDAALETLGSRPHITMTGYADHATDAIVTAAWLRANAHRVDLWNPPALTPEIRRTEGWTFGVT